MCYQWGDNSTLHDGLCTYDELFISCFSWPVLYYDNYEDIDSSVLHVRSFSAAACCVNANPSANSVFVYKLQAFH